MNSLLLIFAFSLPGGPVTAHILRHQRRDVTPADSNSIPLSTSPSSLSPVDEDGVPAHSLSNERLWSGLRRGENVLQEKREGRQLASTEEVDMDRDDGANSEGEDGASDSSEDMGLVRVTYEEMYAILAFLFAATAMGTAASKLEIPELIGELLAGVILGPPLLDLVPYPESLVLVGQIGLLMLFLEAGVQLDVAQLRETGVRAFLMALTGVVLPLAVGTGLAVVGVGASFKSALAVGAPFSPTSLGVAASALKIGNMLDTPVGQLIVASCVIDNALALVLLSMLEFLASDGPPTIGDFVPLFSSIGYLIVLGGLGVTALPGLIEDRILKKFGEGPNRNLALFSVMVFILMAYLPALHYCKASYFTGAFLAGTAFSQIENAHSLYVEKTDQLASWLMRLYFAASIGFQIPVKKFGDPYVIAWGFALYLCIAAKLPLALFIPQFEDFEKGAGYNPFLRDRIIAGLTMTCRSGFSLIIAVMALGEGLFTAQMYAAIVWSVLLSCITSPLMLGKMFGYFHRRQIEYLAKTNPIKLEGGKDGIEVPFFLHIKAKGPAFGGMQESFRKIANELGLEVIERRTNRNGRGLTATIQTDLYVRDTTMTTRLLKISAQRKIKMELMAAMRPAPPLGEMRLSRTASTLSSRLLGHSTRGSFSSILSFDDMERDLSSYPPGHSIRSSLRLLKNSSLGDMEKDTADSITRIVAEKDILIERCDLIKKRLDEALGHDTEVAVDVWNPWPWMEVLDKIASYYNVTSKNTIDNIGVFVEVFDKIDVDGGGSIDRFNIYDILMAVGVDITEEGVLTLVATIDENGDGLIDRDNWKEAVEFYLELKEEEERMARQEAGDVNYNAARIMKELRAKRLAQLGEMGKLQKDLAILSHRP